MTDKEQPPAYTPPGVGFEQHQMTNPAAAGGQTNYGFSQPQQPGFASQPGYFVGQHQVQHNIVVAQVGGGNHAIQPAPIDYSTQAWIACLCCFWPTGLIAIMKASESRDALARGDLAAAHAASNTARQMVRISWAIGVITVILLAVIFGVLYGVVLSSVSSSSCCLDSDCSYC
ncbi:proline-rich transmembrane protein 1-like [Ruditapes philippinarum]|uniref:proline-rich transmembrane protein 1-like n=1 Tax=Ruditapes philippinarum TaxID=129788 RepID=UPI00295B41B0|nr:proline-rich transmembrane protein 1-like [Ruditapes philippinarum]